MDDLGVPPFQESSKLAEISLLAFPQKNMGSIRTFFAQEIDGECDQQELL